MRTKNAKPITRSERDHMGRANGCGEYARGSGVCRNCLVAELQVAVPTVDWPGFVVAMINSRNRIIDAELAIFIGISYSKDFLNRQYRHITFHLPS